MLRLFSPKVTTSWTPPPAEVRGFLVPAGPHAGGLSHPVPGLDHYIGYSGGKLESSQDPAHLQAWSPQTAAWPPSKRLRTDPAPHPTAVTDPGVKKSEFRHNFA